MEKALMPEDGTVYPIPPHIEYLQGLATRPQYNLSDSCGPSLSLSELSEIIDVDFDFLLNTTLGYNSLNGSVELQKAILDLPAYASDVPLHVSVFSGAQEAIYCAMTAILSPNDHVVVASPSYPSLKLTPSILKANVIECPMDQGFDVDAFCSAITDSTKLVIVNSPHNPTGYDLCQTDIEKIITQAKKNDVWVLFDDVSAWLNPELAHHTKLHYDKAFSINVLSKAYGLPGVRVGWLVTRNHWLNTQVQRTRSFTSICTARLDDCIATQVLTHQHALIQRTRVTITQNEQYFCDKTAEFEGICYQPNSAALVGQVVLRSLNKQSLYQLCDIATSQYNTLLLPLDLFGSQNVGFRLGKGNVNFHQATHGFVSAYKALGYN